MAPRVSPFTQPKLKFTYFPIHARGAYVRLAMAVGGLEFEDVQVDFKDWPAIKEQQPFLQLPTLTIDDKVVAAQSLAILRYVGRLTNLYPEDALVALKVDELIDSVDELLVPLAATLKMEAEAKVARRKELCAVPDGQICVRLRRVEQFIRDYGKNGFAVGGRLTIADLRLRVMIHQLEAGFFDNVPVDLPRQLGLEHILRNCATVDRVPAVQAWNRKNRTPTKLRLVYFPSPGRAEAMRLALKYAKVPFEDERITREELAKRKPELPYGQLPVLYIGDEPIAQSSAILHYIGNVTGTTPDSPEEAARMDEILGAVDDVTSTLVPTFSLPDDEKVKAREALLDSKLNPLLQRIETRLAKFSSADGFSVGKDFTLADFQLFSLGMMVRSGMLDGIPKTLLDAYPKIVAVCENVRKEPSIAAYYGGSEQKTE